MNATSTDILDFAALLSPLSRKEPTGKNLREDNALLPLYHQLKDARTAARTIERQQIRSIAHTARPDWRLVFDLSIDILCTKSKDLEVAAWLIEALLREQGFAGLSQGFSLVRQLCEKFWNKLYPLPDEEGIISRVAPLTGLNGEEVEGSLIAPLALIPLTQGNTTGPFALWQYRQALELLKIADADKRAQRVTAGNVSLEMIECALQETAPEFLNNQRRRLKECIQEYELLSEELIQKCQADAPPSSRILAQLHACLDCINCINASSVENTAPPVLQDDHTQPATPPASTLPSPTTITSREQVLQSILQAAHFFRSTEPHSPVSYVLERAVRWAKTPLPELLQELIQDENARGQLSHLTGIAFEK